MQFRAPVLAFGILWLVAAVCGLTMLAVYESKAAPESSSPPSWPAASKLPRGSAFTLVAAFHPHCPCSNATVDELGLLLTRCPNVEADLLFLQPTGFPESWVKSSLWRRVQSMPRVRCFIDENGAEAALFNEQTSGQLALYNRQGKLVFDGGITAARGHAGDNAGLDSIVALAGERQPALRHTDAFGCPLNEKRASVCRQ